MPLDFKGQQQLDKLRLSREKTEVRLVDTRDRLQRLQHESQRLIGTGASSAKIKATQININKIKVERTKLVETVLGSNTKIADIIEGFAAQLKPEELFNKLDGKIPIALLPSRLETRFDSQVNKRGRTRRLRIRIYPDQIHIDAHSPGLSPAEIELGEQYWQLRKAGTADAIQAAWERLAQALSPTRAAWIVQALTPINFDKRDADLVFPKVSVQLDNNANTPKAKLLPDRWVALGYRRIDAIAGYSPLFRKWGRAVPDSLHVTVSTDDEPEDGVAETIAEDALPIDHGMLWTVDYPEAERVGMAITVTDRDLKAGHKLSAGIDLLVVLGVDWTVGAQDSAENMANLLAAHHFSDGMAFVPQGTPTNNTEPARSGFTTDPVVIARTIDPTQPPTRSTHDHAAARMSQGMGLTDSAVLNRVPYADLQEQSTTANIVGALWESTLGYYLDELLDPLVSDHAIDAARDHAAKYLQPSGPFSGFRIGKQPYGLIPVIAPQHFKPDRPDGTENELHSILETVSAYWKLGLSRVSVMGNSAEPDEDLLAILQLNPVSVAKKFRRVIDSETTTNLRGFEDYEKVNTYVRQALAYPQLKSLIGSALSASKLMQMLAAPTDALLFGPWTQASGKASETTSGQTSGLENKPTLKPNYIKAIINNMRGGKAGRKALHKQTSSNILFEALLAYSALHELDRSTTKVIDRYLVSIGKLDAMPFKSSLPTRSIIGIHASVASTIDKPVKGSAQARLGFIETPEQQANLILPAVTGAVTRPLSDYISEQVFKHRRKKNPELRNLKTFVASLEALASRPAADIDRSFRSTLDCYSHRLDAWYTSLASRRLQQVRKSTPVGVYIGGYGWVEDLHPDEKVHDSLGFVHAPSIDHAATAAILRSGHLSHRGTQNSTQPVGSNAAESALNIDLSSEQVSLALKILDGVAQGQPLAALLGYRFERLLRDGDSRLMQFLLPIRQLAPLRQMVPDVSAEASESIAVRDVVDGLQLLEKWRDDPTGFLSKIKNLTITTSQQATITTYIKKIDDILDAISDVLVSESVYQTVRGNYERAGAALSALDRQAKPPDPQVVKTPRSGTLCQQKVIVMLQETKLPKAWMGVEDLRARVAPRLNRWIAELIGDPNRVDLVTEVHDEGADGGTNGAAAKKTKPIVLEATLLDFLNKGTNLSPLSLVLASVATSADMPSELELMVAHFFAEQVTNPTETMSLQLREESLVDNPSTVGDRIGFSALLSLLKMISKVVTQPRAADIRDFTPAEGEVSPEFDADDLRTRLKLVTEALTDAIERFDVLIDIATPEQLHSALQEAIQLGIADAVPDVSHRDPEAAKILKAQALSVRDLLVQKQTALQSNQTFFEKQTDSSNQQMANHLVEQIRTVLGKAFPVVPLFQLKETEQLLASQGDRKTLVGDDDFAPLTWLQQMAMVRPQIDKVVSVLTASEMLGASLPGNPFQVMQLPHVPKQRWVARNLPGPDSEPLLSLVTLGSYTMAKPLAGLVCDGWSEIIPATHEMTAISFHYDAPAARAPQSAILAVPPDLNQKEWSFDAVLDSVLHAHELAKLRMVGPKEIPVLGGGILPMIYIPQDKTEQIPSIDLTRLYEAGHVKEINIIGKTNINATF